MPQDITCDILNQSYQCVVSIGTRLQPDSSSFGISLLDIVRRIRIWSVTLCRIYKLPEIG
ncbi:hypothetical protein F3B26_17810 [Bacteroides fragilis]|nr:hypothetical protein F3B26_17810 [Bacteroides fragilis]